MGKNTNDSSKMQEVVLSKHELEDQYETSIGISTDTKMVFWSGLVPGMTASVEDAEGSGLWALGSGR